MWPSVAIVVEENKLGTAYGLMTMIQNIGLFSFNVLIGWANDFSGASAANPCGYRLECGCFQSWISRVVFLLHAAKNEQSPRATAWSLAPFTERRA